MYHDICIYIYIHIHIHIMCVYLSLYTYIYIYIYFFAGRHRDVRVPGIRHASKRTLSRSANAFRGPVGGPRGR